ncbi:MAG: hypothetical protein U0T77_00195 [Chitinophagales bacterium]
MKALNQAPQGNQPQQMLNETVDLNALLIEYQYDSTVELFERLNNNVSVNDLIKDSQAFQKTHQAMNIKCFNE